MKKITHIAEILNDNTRITPRELLLDAINDIETGVKSPNKLAIFMLDDKDDKYATNFYASNMRTSELIALCARWNYNFNNWMDE